MTVPLPTPDGPATTNRPPRVGRSSSGMSPEGASGVEGCLPPALVEQVVLRCRAGAGAAPAGGGLQLFTDLAGAAFAPAGERFEHRRPLHLPAPVVVLPREDISQRDLLRLELCLQLGPPAARLGGL